MAKRKSLYGRVSSGKGGAGGGTGKRFHETDPYDTMAATYRQMGRRFPEPYSAAAADVARFNQHLRGVAATRIDSQNAYRADSVAGRRITHQGFAGKGLYNPATSTIQNYSARQQMGYQQTGERSPFFTDEWEATTSNIRNSGFITINDPAFSMQVPQDRPWLTLVCPSLLGSADVVVAAKMPGVTATDTGTVRRFFIGGGWTGQFFLPGFENISFRVMQTNAAQTRVDFAWTKEAIMEDQTIYRPQFWGAGVTNLVPTGAYAFWVQNTDVNWVWDAPVLPGWNINVGAFPTWPGVVAGQENKVLGTRYTTGAANSILWFIRPI